MHHIETKGGTAFNFNPDLSGQMCIVNNLGAQVWIPAADLTEFWEAHQERYTPAETTVANLIRYLRELPEDAEVSVDMRHGIRQYSVDANGFPVQNYDGSTVIRVEIQRKAAVPDLRR